ALELGMQGVVAADQVRGAGAGAFAGGGVLQCGADLELRGQAQVVVTAEAGQPLAVDLEADAVAAGHGTALAQAALRRAESVAVADAFVDIDAAHVPCASPRGSPAFGSRHPAPLGR